MMKIYCIIEIWGCLKNVSDYLPLNSLLVKLTISTWKLQEIPRPATLLKEGLHRRCFPVKFSKFFRTVVLNKTWKQLPLLCFPIKLLAFTTSRCYYTTRRRLSYLFINSLLKTINRDVYTSIPVLKWHIKGKAFFHMNKFNY